VPSAKRKGLNSLVARWLWKHRNACIFEGLYPSVSMILYDIKEDAILWCLAGAYGLSTIWPSQPFGRVAVA
jgi:hypothetical protein